MGRELRNPDLRNVDPQGRNFFKKFLDPKSQVIEFEGPEINWKNRKQFLQPSRGIVLFGRKFVGKKQEGKVMCQ